MTFEEFWKEIPIPANYYGMDDAYKLQWKLLVERAFCRGLFEGTHKSASAKTADSKRISDLEAAVAEIQETMSTPNRIGATAIDEFYDRSKHASEAAERIPPVRVEIEALGLSTVREALQKAKEMRSALRVIYTLCCCPDSFDLQHVKHACLSALGRQE